MGGLKLIQGVADDKGHLTNMLAVDDQNNLWFGDWRRKGADSFKVVWTLVEQETRDERPR